MNHFDDDYDADFEAEDIDDSSQEYQIWQWLLLINPGDEDLAQQQFAAYRELVADEDPASLEPIQALCQVSDWQSSFQVETADTRTLIQAIDELTARWNLSVDWDGDTDDDDFHAEIDAAELLARAYDHLAPHGYTLWLWDSEEGCCAGGISLSRDSEAMRELAARLQIQLRLGSEAG